MLTFMHETCNKNIDLLDNFAENGQSFELREMFGKFTMDTIASCAFGLDPQASTHKGPFLYYVSTFRGRGRKGGGSSGSDLLTKTNLTYSRV